ncbi:hypothetical protein GCM10012275_60250 [Longimycelium tulufanense]|uniref:Uncharacterized protein n=1 Tax=Longimycelium tulufanense TaxID=907463 RepID=A0A8J3CKC7_9PSEU|nr:hypothetical protein GCM10012275_60250 [Longimycelium tulufanense]
MAPTIADSREAITGIPASAKIGKPSESAYPPTPEQCRHSAVGRDQEDGFAAEPDVRISGRAEVGGIGPGTAG